MIGLKNKTGTMNKPNFLCVGAQKAGTSSIHKILSQHSQIFMSERKEIHFFDWEEQFELGNNWYLEHFKNVDNQIIIGETSPTYMYIEKVPERIFNLLGKDIKLLFVLRNPADRAFSNYKMIVGRKEEKYKFKKAILNDLSRIKNNIEYQVDWQYINKGFYFKQINRFLKFFPKENMFFIIFEDDFLNNRKETFSKLYKFLGVDYQDIPLNIKITPQTKLKSDKADKILNTAHPINQLAKKLIPSKKIRTNIKYFFTNLNQKPTADKIELDEMKPYLINEIYKTSILELETLIDRDLSSWLKF